MAEPEHQSELDQPGLRELREAVGNARRHLPGGKSLRRDMVAGANNAIANVPDGMANAIVVGVNPIFGLYAVTVGPIVGGVLSSTRLMVVTTTAAASLTAAQSLARVPEDDRATALVAMVLLVGVFQLLFGLLGFGRLIRFVSYSVSTGFVTGIAVLLILSQIPTVTGYDAPDEANRVVQAAEVLRNLDEIHLTSLGLAIVALTIGGLLPRTRVGNVSRLVAIVVPSLLLAVLGLEGVEIVDDVGEIPRGLPTPVMPRLSPQLWFQITGGALSVAVVVLVQGAGVSQSVPNPDGSRSRMSRDFMAQGGANVASGLVQGLPVGGSVTVTSLSVLSGATTRWATILAGLWVALLVLTLPQAIAAIAMPTLGALLTLAGVSSIKPGAIAAIWNGGWPSVATAGITFVSMLAFPIEVAVGVGVVMSAVLYLQRSASDVSIVELVEHEDGRGEERNAPSRLRSYDVVVLDVYGHLFYAGARKLERLLPGPSDAEHPVVILRLHGRSVFGATLVDVLSNYAEKVHAAGGRMYLSGINEKAYKQTLANPGKLKTSEPIAAFGASPYVGESTRQAEADARDWLASLRDREGREDDEEGDDTERDR